MGRVKSPAAEMKQDPPGCLAPGLDLGHDSVVRPASEVAIPMSAPASDPLPALPPSLHAERQGAVALLRLARPDKRNALDDALVLGIEAFFSRLPDGVKAVVLHGEGEHFSAGLDLGELTQRDMAERVAHSQM